MPDRQEEHAQSQLLLLARESLASFLSELDDADGLFTPPVAPRDTHSSLRDVIWPKKMSAAKNSAKVGPTRNTKAHHECRVKKLREEIHVLFQELKRLQQEAADSDKGRDSANWKRHATYERFMKGRAEYANAFLKHRLAENARFGEKVRKLLLKQQELQPREVVQVQFGLVDDDARVFGLLRADLLHRQHQLQASMPSRLNEITRQSLLIRDASQLESNWDVTENEQSLHIDVEGFSLLPFSAALLSEAICQYTQSGTVQIDGDKVVDRVVRDIAANDVELSVALDRVSGGRELGCRSILRRVRHENGIILLWETMSQWQSSDARDGSPHAVVRESGCSVIGHARVDLAGLSAGYCGKSVRISSSDGSCMDKSDPLVRKIVHTCQEFHSFHLRRMESMFIDCNLQQQHQTQVAPTTTVH